MVSQLRPKLSEKQLLVSVVAGTKLKDLQVSILSLSVLSSNYAQNFSFVECRVMTEFGGLLVCIME